jgi:hypothetical protein
MNKSLNRLRRILCTFSGEDDYIIRQCNTRIQISFALIGIFVVLIFGGCWVSASSFMYQLFDGSSRWISLPVGIVWALLVTNLYLLLLYTVSPTLLPVVFKSNDRKKSITVYDRSKSKSLFTFSMVSRLALISLLAIIIAQPLNVLLLSSFANSTLENYKTEYKVSMMIEADSSLIKQEILNKADFEQKVNTRAHLADSASITISSRLLNDKVFRDERFLIQSKQMLDTLNRWNNLYSTGVSNKSDSIRDILAIMLQDEISSDNNFISEIDNLQFSNHLLEAEFGTYRKNLKNTIVAKIENYTRLNNLLSKSNFYIKKIQILLSKNLFSWFVTFLVCGLFLLPIYWKFSIRNRSGFYEKKQQIENQIVVEDYQEFKAMYAETFRVKTSKINSRTIELLSPLIEKLKTVNPNYAAFIISDVKNELSNEPVTKYEYWADHPFRTQPKTSTQNLASEKELIDTLYNQTN